MGSWFVMPPSIEQYQKLFRRFFEQKYYITCTTQDCLDSQGKDVWTTQCDANTICHILQMSLARLQGIVVIAP